MPDENPYKEFLDILYRIKNLTWSEVLSGELVRLVNEAIEKYKKYE